MDSDLADAIDDMRSALIERADDISACQHGTALDPVLALASEMIATATEYHWYATEADRRGLLSATQHTIREAARVWRKHGGVAFLDGAQIEITYDATPEQIATFGKALPLAILHVDDVAERTCAALAMRTRRIICGIGR